MIGIVIVGVGGQGTLLASKILGHIALQHGYDVRVSEVHGMSQRGGSVVTFVRMSATEPVYSTLVEQEQADVVLAFEKLEALRALPYVKPKTGTVIVNTQQILPMPVITGAAMYPDDAVARISASAPHTVALDATAIATECGTHRAANVVLLGVLARKLPFTREAWMDALAHTVKPQFLEMNKAAFDRGYTYAGE